MLVKIGALQFNPTLGKPHLNAETILGILRAAPTKPDILVLPEFAATGYNFRSRAAIEPFLEEVGRGASSDLARAISREYNCFTLIGYPEKHLETIYNSALLVGPDGSTLHNYRKTHLYSADEEFGCSENPDKTFSAVDVILDKDFYHGRNTSRTYHKYKVNIGICMDLNPYKFEAPFMDFEFASRCLEQQLDLVLCPMAWLSGESPSIDETISEEAKNAAAERFQDRFFSNPSSPVYPEGRPELAEGSFSPVQPSKTAVDYWIVRFFPFLISQLQKKTVFVACNRTGVESTTVYGGSSAIWEVGTGFADPRIHDSTNKKVTLHGAMGQGNEGLLVREVELV